MPISRKCPECQHWNGEESHCVKCGKTLDPTLIREEKDSIKAEMVQKPSSLDLFFDGMKESNWILIRGLYWIGYSVWLVFFSILSFFIALIAWTPG